MRKHRVSDKFSVMLVICDNEKMGILEEYIATNKLTQGLIFRGKGTAESEVADIFGFGLSDKEITCVLVRESGQEKTLKEVSDLLGLEVDTYGLAMLLEVSSASSLVLNNLGIDIQAI